MSFVISRTLLNRGLLNRGSTVLNLSLMQCPCFKTKLVCFYRNFTGTSYSFFNTCV